MAGSIELDDRIGSWWLWFTVALFLLIPLDLLTTLFAVAQYGVGAEANPVMRLLIDQGLPTLLAAHLLVVALVVSLFRAVIGSVRRSSPASRSLLVPLVSVWLVLLNITGLALVANNISLLL